MTAPFLPNFRNYKSVMGLSVRFNDLEKRGKRHKIKGKKGEKKQENATKLEEK